MQIAAETAKFQSLPSATLSEFSDTVRPFRFSWYGLTRCNGAVLSFEPSKIPVAVTKVFLAVNCRQSADFAALQLQVIDDGIVKLLDLGCQTGCAPSWDPSIGPIG